MRKMWFDKTTENKLFAYIFVVSLIVLCSLLIWNWFSGKTGTYTDYTSMIADLMQKKVSKRKNIPFESRGEKECRRVIENLLDKPFPKARPRFMVNKISGHNLELDCYNDELKIAVEYNGEQHYKYLPYFHNNKDAFYNLKYRDDIKKTLCDQNGITLITVPYTVKTNDIKNFITSELKKKGLIK